MGETKRRRGVPQEDLEKEYPTLAFLTGPPGRVSQRAWVAVFNENPDAMHALLADFIKQAHAKPGRIGQRPMPKEEQVDFHTLMYAEDNNRPMLDILPELIAAVGLSERGMAQRARMSRTQWQRLIRGEYDPDVNEIRRIAEVLKKPPIFFVEYRKAMAIAAFVNLLDERPGFAVTLYKKYLEVKMP